MIYNYENTIGIGKRFSVTVDGVDAKNVFFADTDKGIVRFHDIDHDGNLYVDKMTGEPAIKEAQGIVVVTPIKSSAKI